MTPSTAPERLRPFSPRTWCETYRTGPFVVRLVTDYEPLLDLLVDLYPERERIRGETIVSFHVSMLRGRGIRRWWRPKIEFLVDRTSPFAPYPLDHAFPMLEWGVNWCIATRSHQYLMLHSGALERGGRALLLPAAAGSGKSTLSAALSFRGWRLLSDEFGLYDPRVESILPLPRAVPLKNRSIEVIRRFAPEAHLGPLFPKTRKGDVAHLRPPGESLKRQHQAAEPAWIVFPRYTPGSPAELAPIPNSLAFTRLSQNAFNIQLLGSMGFDSLVALVRQCACYSLAFDDLDEAADRLRALVA